MYERNIIICLVFVWVILPGPSAICQQSKNRSIILSGRAHYGFIIPHSKRVRPVSGSRPWGIESEINWQLHNDTVWQYCTCYPRTGLSFFYTNFSNPQVLGSSYAIYAFIEPLIGAGSKFYGSMRFGIGPTYLDHVYDSVINPTNRFFGSHLSFVVLLDAALNYRLSERIALRLTGSFNHISNGGIQEPNSGMNFPTISLGAEYNLNPIPFTHRVKDNIDLIKYKNRIDLMGHATGKTDIKGHKHYPVYGLTASYSRVVGRLSAVSVGLELTSDMADKHEIERLNLTADDKHTDHKYAGMLIGHDLLLGRFNFYIQLGVYLYSPFERMDPVYQRYGLNYYIYKNLIIGTNIKAHRYEADFLDFRIGYSFK